MPEITLMQVAEAVQRLRATTIATIEALKLPDPADPSRPYPITSPSAPASEEQISAAEVALGRHLPPSYCHFLSLHDGWNDFDLGSDLLPVGAVVEFNMARAPAALEVILDEIGRETVEGLIVFGTTSSDNSMLIFDSGRSDEFGEWRVIDFDAEEGMLDEYDNFLDFLHDTAATVRMMAGR